jgi:hypothetical protein
LISNNTLNYIEEFYCQAAMKIKKSNYQLKTNGASFKGFVWHSIIFMILNANLTFGQNNPDNDAFNFSSSKENKAPKEKKFKMTTLAFGGNGALWTKVNKQSTIMSGGRGSATFNNRYTFGGGGWGMPKGIEIESNEAGTYDFVKMGYGGLEFGYIIFPGEKLTFGSNALIAGGAIFKESVPESDDEGFKMFPVLEPGLYGQISLGTMLRFEVGASYRYVTGTNLSYISDQNLSGFSVHIGLLVKACKCDQ